MKDLLPFIVVGATQGSVYGLAGMGLVLTYKASGIFNFAHGSIAAAAGFVFYELRDLRGWPWPVAAAVCLFVVAPIFGVVLERLARTLSQQPPALRIVATVGLLGALTGAVSVRYGAVLVQVRPFLPQRNLRFVGINVGLDQLLTMSTSAVLAVGLWWFFRTSRLGLAMRAVVEDPDLVSLGGTNPTAVRRWAWMIGSAFAGLSGLLLAPIFGLDPNLLTLVVVYSFGAAALGAFSNLPATFLGGLGIGIVANLSIRVLRDYSWAGGVPASIPFIVLFATLVLLPRTRLVDAADEHARTFLTRTPRLPLMARRGGLAAVLVAATIVPHVVGARLPLYTNGMVFVILFLSFRLLVRTSGQVSLCHAAFAAIGASSFAHFTTGLGLPWFGALLLAGIVCVPVGAFVALPAIRLSGLYLAIVTLGFGILVSQLFYLRGFMFGDLGQRDVPRPKLPFLDTTTDVAYYYVAFAVVLATMLLIHLIHAGRIGRLMQVLAESPTALTTSGASPNVTRVLVFSISAFTAGIAGALFGGLLGTTTSGTFNALTSLQWLTILILGGSSRYGSAFVAAMLVAVLPGLASGDWATWAPVLYGFAVVAYASMAGRTTWLDDLLRSPRLLARRRGTSPVESRRPRARADLPVGPVT
jgi:branched-subunit amino acid ABC-type transport system permease component